MPVFDQGYRPYDGEVRTRLFRWWPIAVTGLRGIRKLPVVVVLIAGAIPLIIKLFHAYAVSAGGEFLPMMSQFLEYNDAFFFGLLSVETFFVVMMLMVVGSGQIAEDVRTGAMQLYFSKPITQLDYVLGKLGAVVLAALTLTLVPGAILFFTVCLLAPDWSWLTANPLLPLKIAGFSLVVSVVLGAFVLGVSSLGKQGRLVALCFAGAYFLSSILGGGALPSMLDDPRWEVAHLGNSLDAAGLTFFPEARTPGRFEFYDTIHAPTGIAWLIIAGVLAGSIALLMRRVRAVEVVS